MKIFCTLVCFLAPAATAAAAVQPAALRCEYRVNPLGIDVARPRLSWIIESAERGQRQTAYRVLVATSAERLAADEGNLWDSGRVASDQTIHVVYAGRPLGSRMACFWKVRAWDARDQASPWSRAASWSMGLLDRADWQAQWIADSKTAGSRQTPPHNGYHSALANSPDAAKWVSIDLGKPQPVDAVRLYPARPFDWSPDTPGFLFPVRLKIEAGQAADGSDLKVVVDRTAADIPNPGAKPVEYRFPAVTARLVRLTATRLARRDKDNFGLALAEMEVLSGEKNLALGAPVHCLDSIESGAWSKAKLVDGRTLPERGQVGMSPATMLRKEFQIGGPVRRATVYATGLGLYELRLNGRRVGERILSPEWTRYSKRIQYQTYDVTSLVRPGANAIGAILGEGWYAGPMMLKPPISNPVFRLLLRLEIERADGRVETIVTDPSWQGTTEGPLRQSGIYFGETYDATKEIPGWDLPGCAAAGWRPVQTVRLDPDAVLCAQKNEPIHVVKEIKPVKVTEPRPGQHVFDLGQNMVGWCRLKVRGPAGTKVTLRHGEMLSDDGTLYTANLRGAEQVNEYTLSGRSEEVFEPHFTYHGFRYVELSGLPVRPGQDAILGRVFHSSAPDAGRFECSNPLLTRLMRNIVWTQRANLMSAPTDCPQRTEREGWMGDIQAFSQTAVFNMDMAAFFTKWIQDIRDSQADDGRYPDIAPHVTDPNQMFSGVPAWGDAGTIVPWRMYQNYADVRLLREHFESACRWVEFIRRNNPDLLWLKARGNDYGDWLNGDTLVLKDYPHGRSEAPKDLLATAFFAHSTEIVAKMAKALGRADAAAKYAKLHQEIRTAFNRAYVGPDGTIKGDTQAGYALALSFNLLDEPLRPKAVEHLLAAIARYKGHLSTGIQSTHRAMLELTRNGRHEEAGRLICLRSVPSWGYMIDQGATTIWERWDGYVRGRGFQDPGMNSFNHWAFGAVGEWLWRELAGINPDEQNPGFKHFILRPRPGAGTTWVNGRYDSIHGTIESRWTLEGDRLTLDVTVPANTTATIYVPAKSAGAVTEGGVPLAQAPGVKLLRMEDAAAVLEVVSGRYAFRSVVARVSPTPKAASALSPSLLTPSAHVLLHSQ
jgi:alpha-L-rhamnosidase